MDEKIESCMRAPAEFPVLHRVCNFVEALYRLLGVASFLVMASAVSFEIVMRYLFDSPTFWAEALARNAMIWMVLLGFSVGIRRKENISIEIIADQAQGALRPTQAWARWLLVLAFASVLLIYGWQMALVNMRQTIAGLNIQVGWVQLVVPIAAAGMILFTIELIAKRDWSRF